MFNTSSFFRYEMPFDSTTGKDEILLKEKNENIKIINEALADGIINPRLQERHLEAEIENFSFYFASEDVEEITKLALCLGDVSNTVEYNYGLLGISPFLDIESKFDEISEEAKGFLIMDNVMRDTIGIILDKVSDILSDRRYKIELYLSRDMEIEDWEELVFSIKVAEKDFKKIIELWDKIEVEAQEIINMMEMERVWEIPHIEKIDEMLSIEMGGLEDV